MASSSGKSATQVPRAERGLTRRSILTGSAAGSAALLASYGASGRQAGEDTTVAPEETVSTVITINGDKYALAVDPRTTLLDLLREQLDLTGTKVGCNHGQCGACTVLLDGVRVNSCFVLAAAANGKSVVTIEGLARPDSPLHPMQAAFIEEDGFQCGYCTPGQVMSAIGCVEEGHANSRAEIREYMSGNICRCGAYKGIVDAIERARDETRKIDVSSLPRTYR